MTGTREDEIGAIVAHGRSGESIPADHAKTSPQFDGTIAQSIDFIQSDTRNSLLSAAPCVRGGHQLAVPLLADVGPTVRTSSETTC